MKQSKIRYFILPILFLNLATGDYSSANVGKGARVILEEVTNLAKALSSATGKRSDAIKLRTVGKEFYETAFKARFNVSGAGSGHMMKGYVLKGVKILEESGHDILKVKEAIRASLRSENYVLGKESEKYLEAVTDFRSLERFRDKLFHESRFLKGDGSTPKTWQISEYVSTLYGCKKCTRSMISFFDESADLTADNIRGAAASIVRKFMRQVRKEDRGDVIHLRDFAKDFANTLAGKIGSAKYSVEVYSEAVRSLRFIAAGLKGFGDGAEKAFLELADDINDLGQAVAKSEGKVVDNFTTTPLLVPSLTKNGKRVEHSFSGIEGVYQIDQLGINSNWVDSFEDIVKNSFDRNTLAAATKELRRSGQTLRDFGLFAPKYDKLGGERIIKVFEEAINEYGATDEVIVEFFSWMTRNSTRFSIASDDIAETISDILKSKDLYHLLDSPQLEKVFDENPEIWKALEELF